jgi:hypothetical protein
MSACGSLHALFQKGHAGVVHDAEALEDLAGEAGERKAGEA